MKIAVFFFMLFLCAECCAFNCTITTTPVNFGTYDVFSSVLAESTGTITVTCNNPPNHPLYVTVSVSKGSAANFNPRRMISTGGDRLDYYLFTNATRSTILGDGTGGSAIIGRTITRYTPLNETIYGRIPPLQNVGVGVYGDTLTATVVW